MAIDHTSISVPEDKFKECVALYVKALEPLGYEIAYQFGEYTVGFGSKLDAREGYKVADFWAKGAKEVAKEGAKAHIAFRTSDRAAVDAFHAAAVSAGGQDNGAPGVRAHYHANYYAAYVLDAAGNNIEVVCHNP
ncbi:Glyoxalase/Bleomycin resistance protein/Dihydroxybiphenyl dioxygenase [Trichoderma sp. SZMC 28013]